MKDGWHAHARCTDQRKVDWWRAGVLTERHLKKATEHFTRFQHVVMNHITEAVNAVRQRERSSNASSNVSSKRVLLAGDERNRRAAYWAMKKVEARRLAEEQPIRRSRLEAVNKEPEWKKSLTSTRSGKSTVSKQISAND
ncbi:hypothetical protein H257_06012 [Aphanomyces astaci]|uniref:Uncharacterized protein n=1 Tax=Aphanomyces astaci TaxID=112090 RepID=W4GQB1_APHAT|nr:hypothetical protein H257_06012 [Aphanomyces astaci]ETV81516.1 hypothetical protein H257_06012 [Aphanomyces astaci]|eukprot:XP_009829374.1 hypothetical protein H257_06012 [Aphanomyces astaci]